MSAPLDDLRSSFKGDLIVPSDSDYPAAIARWAINAERPAKVVAFVKDAEDVALAIKHAKEQNTPLAIRSGGHSASGASSSDGGLVIDLSRYLNGVKVDAEKKLAYVDGGALWETVDKTAIKHGLATVAGTVNHTGVGGLLLGGGFGHLTPALGLVIDNLVQATVVTASGSILTASATENSDLFWGIRGGGCNFGVCTEFVLKLHPQRATVFAGLVMFPPSAVDKVFSALCQWWKKGPSVKESIIAHFGRGPGGTVRRQPFAGLILFYNGTAEEGRATYKSLFDIGPVADMTGEIPYEEVNTLINPVTPHGKNVHLKSVYTTSPDPSVMKHMFDTLLDISEPYSPDMNVIIVHEFVSSATVSKVAKDATAYAQRDPMVNVLSFINWAEDTPQRTAFSKDGSAQLLKIVTNSEKIIDDKDNIGYGNHYAEGNTAPETMNKAKILYGDNYPRLQQLKRKYDPDLLFSKWFPIVPAAVA